MKIKHLVVIGVGLIGGSFALALREKQLVERVSGVGRSLDNLLLAKKLSIIDEYHQQIAPALVDADMVFIAVPVAQYKTIFEQLKAHVRSDIIITDAGSTKTSVLNTCEQVYGEIPDYFIPGHPIAGTENSGAVAAFASLYEQHKVILTPHQGVSQEKLSTVHQLWQAIGAQVFEMDAQHHDRIMGATSHLPHTLAFCLVNMLANSSQQEEIFRFVAGGFKDFTRIASSDPEMWRDICLLNKTALSEHLHSYQNELSNMLDAIENNDGAYLSKLFEKAKQARDKAIES